MFTELYRDEKKEEGDRGGQKDKVFATVWNTQKFTELGRVERG